MVEPILVSTNGQFIPVDTDLLDLDLEPQDDGPHQETQSATPSGSAGTRTEEATPGPQPGLSTNNSHKMIFFKKKIHRNKQDPIKCRPASRGSSEP